jgi:hypothetical protein
MITLDRKRRLKVKTSEVIQVTRMFVERNNTFQDYELADGVIMTPFSFFSST